MCIQVTVQNKIIGQKIGIKFECENGRVKRNAEFFNLTESTEFDNASNLEKKEAPYTCSKENVNGVHSPSGIWAVDFHRLSQILIGFNEKMTR